LILCDPQTSGGLLITSSEPADDFLAIAEEEGFELEPIGEMAGRGQYAVVVE